MDDLKLHGIIGTGGIKEFFGDGSDGTIPDLNLITTAPNGGTVANLWDMNAVTVFTTGTLSSASDQVVFSIDFGKPYNVYALLWQSSISVGTRTIKWQYSDDNVSWSDYLSGSITTSLGDKLGFGGSHPAKHRYWRVLLLAGGSNCTFSCQGATLNWISPYTQTTKVFRIIEPSTLNGEAVVKQYTEYTLPVGYEHTVQNPCQGLIIYSQGDITVNGIIDMSQNAGLAPNGNAIPMLIAPNYIKNAKTSSLLHFDNNITDAHGRTWTNNGAATFDATNKKFGTHAINLNGTNQWIDTPASDDFSFGNDDFTIDCWFRPTSLTGSGFILGSNSSNVAIYRSLDKIWFGIFDSSATQLSGPTALLINTWNHVALVKKNGLIKLYLNGVLEITTLLDKPINRANEKIYIGQRGDNLQYFAGQIDEFRIIKGKAMYTANFTPPTSAYTYQATFSDEVEAFKEYYQMTTRLQMLRGGYGGKGGYGGGYSGSTGRQVSVGIGGAGRQNLGGFGGGGSSGVTSGGVQGSGGVGGSITNAEIGGGSVRRDGYTWANGPVSNVNGVNGSGAIGGGLVNNPSTSVTGVAYGGGTGGTGAPFGSSSNSQYSGGFLAIVCKGAFLNTGAIKVNAGSGSNGGGASYSAISDAGGGGGGGGAGGGVIAIFHKGTYTNNGIVQANGGTGGTGGAGVGTGESGGTGTSGSVGTISTNQL